MKKCLFTGICTALVTPFHEDHVNLPMMRRLLSRQMKSGVTAHVICGTTGEAPTLSDAEKRSMFRAAKDWVNTDGIILAGTGGNCTEKVIELSKAAEDQGVDGLLIVSPYYNKCTASGLIRHYESIAKAVSLPILLYNVPTRTGVDIPVSVYQELAQIENIVGVKEASSDLKKFAEIIRTCPADFGVYSGNDDLLLPTLALGGKGVISVASNVKPGDIKKITDSFFEGNLLKARNQFYAMLPLMKALFSEVNPIPVKAAMRCMGYDCGECRLPLTVLPEEKQKELMALL